MKNKLYFILTFLFLFVSDFYAQNKSGSEMIEDIVKTIDNGRIIKSTFTIEQYSDNGQREFSSVGTLINKGNKYHLDTEDMEIWYDGENQWTYQKNDDEVTIIDISPDEESSTNIVGILKNHDNKYSSSFVGNKDINGKKSAQIVMKPLPGNNDSNWSEINLYIDVTASFPNKIDIKTKNNNNLNILFTEINELENINDNEFIFNKKNYPDVFISDLR